MPFSFPSSPSVGQQSTQNGRAYSWSGYAWELVPASGGLTWSTAPASATASGTAGQIAYDGDYFYVATAENTWERAALSTWSPFTPASIAGLQAWFDASDASTLFDATSGGSLVAADGAVARWQDKSGNARHMTQATSGSRPLRKASVQGGKDVLRLDGVNDSLTIPSSTATFNFLHGADSTVFIVLSRPTDGYAPILHTHNGGTGTTGISFDCVNGSATSDKLVISIDKSSIGNGVALNGSANGFLPSGFSLVTSVARAANATAANRMAVRRNGGSAHTNNTLTNTPSNGDATNDLGLGRDWITGSESFGAFDCAEICIYNAALSDTDRAAVEGYLMTKWAIS